MTSVSRRPRRIATGPDIRTRSVAANAAIVAAAFVVSRLLGLVREVLIARQFGTSQDYDAYVAAFRIPDLLFLVVMSGAFGSAFIPIFGGFLSRGEAERAWRLASVIITYTVVILLLVGQLVFLLAGPLMGAIVAPGLDPVQQELATDLTRLLLLSPLLLGLGAAAKGMLEAQDAFGISSVAPILYNLAIILGAVALAPAFGVYGLAFGVVAGAAAHAGVQFASLFRRGMRFSPSLSRQTEGLAEVARLMAPRLVGQAAFQVNFIVMTNFASRLGESRVSAVNYAYQLFMLPHGVLAMSLSTVIFPMMARQYELGRLGEMRRTLTGALGPLLFLSIPAGVGLYTFRTSIVQMLFQFGSFSAESTALVAEPLGYFALGIVGFAIVEAITRAYYAMHDTRTPVIIAVLTIVANMALSWVLAPRYGHGGLALSLSATAAVEMTILLVILTRRIGGLGLGLVLNLFKMLIAASILGAIGLWLGEPLQRATDPAQGRSIQGLAVFAFTLGSAGLAYLVAAYYLRIPEVHDVLARVRRLGLPTR